VDVLADAQRRHRRTTAAAVDDDVVDADLEDMVCSLRAVRGGTTAFLALQGDQL